MKKIIFSALFLVSQVAMAQYKMPQPSSTQTIVQDFGLGKVEITYSRPNINNRKLFADQSELAPLGEVWRTGANAATRIKITEPIIIANTTLDTGTYAIFTIPGKTEWSFIINKNSKSWGTGDYYDSLNVINIKVPSTKIKNNVETFTMQFANVKPQTCDLQLIWGNTLVSVAISANIVDKLKAQIETMLKGDKLTANNYYMAANFYNEYDKNLPNALVNISKATALNGKAFWMFLTKAKIEKQMGDKVAAKASATQCIEVATQEKNDDYVRMAKELISKL
jgi:Protein of unknown function (DUF2911)